MIKKQLGRRNLSDEQKTFMIGKMYEARKKSLGGNHGNQYTVLPKDQNELLPKSTAEAIANEVGVAAPTVKRAEKFSKGIDALSEISKEASDKILQGKTGITKKTVIEFPNMEPEKQASKTIDNKGIAAPVTNSLLTLYPETVDNKEVNVNISVI